MRKLWPPYYDDFSLGFWAASASLLVTLIGVVMMFISFWISFILGLPGWIAFMMVERRGIEEANFNLSAIIIGIVVNLGFYYLISRWLFGVFRPFQSWWPAKGSGSV